MATDDGAHEEYDWTSALPAHNHSYLVPAICKLLGPGRGRSLIDLGCGNGALTAELANIGYKATGLESSRSGVEQAQLAFPNVRFEIHDLTHPLPVEFGKFDVVLSAEVIEHLFLPRTLFERAHEALAPGGLLIVSTPYHGYLKNLALALTGRFDRHWRPGWDYGHIKFFSKVTLCTMMAEMDFNPTNLVQVGRIPVLAKTMIVSAHSVRIENLDAENTKDA